jgi:hypothetical protein
VPEMMHKGASAEVFLLQQSWKVALWSLHCVVVTLNANKKVNVHFIDIHLKELIHIKTWMKFTENMMAS